MNIRLKIWQKVLVAIVGATALIVFGHLAVLSYTFREGFLGYLNEAQADRVERIARSLEARYQEKGSWDFLAEGTRDRRLRALMMGEAAFRPPPLRRERPFAGGPRQDHPRATERPPRPRGMLPPDTGFAVVDTQGTALIGTLPEGGRGLQRELRVADQPIGTLFLPARAGPFGMIERQFSERRQRLLNFSAVLTLTLAAIVALLLSRHLLAPIQRLTHATRELRGGQYGVRVDASGRDELGILADDFNELAATLENNQRARRQWVADISHELRTPIAVLRAQLDAMVDGLRPLDDNALAALSGEIDRVARLVDDLSTLARSDSGTLSYDKKPVSLCALVRSSLALAEPRLAETGLDLECDLTGLDGVKIVADADRIKQLFANLLNNSLEYTARGGCVRVMGTIYENTARVVIEDSAPGVPQESLPRLFDRLYRVESSRNRGMGGSGLGLSICASIVAAHAGEITATESALGGIAVTVTLPIVPDGEPESAA